MKYTKKIGILFITFSFFYVPLKARIINKALAIVEDKTITSIDLELELNKKYNRKRKISKKRKVVFYEMIDEILINIIAREKTIIITDRRIKNFIKEKWKKVKFLI